MVLCPQVTFAFLALQTITLVVGKRFALIKLDTDVDETRGFVDLNNPEKGKCPPMPNIQLKGT